MEIFKSTESEVRVYSRAFPVIFNRAKNAHLYTDCLLYTSPSPRD